MHVCECFIFDWCSMLACVCMCALQHCAGAAWRLVLTHPLLIVLVVTAVRLWQGHIGRTATGSFSLLFQWNELPEHSQSLSHLSYWSPSHPSASLQNTFTLFLPFCSLCLLFGRFRYVETFWNCFCLFVFRHLNIKIICISQKMQY